MPTMQEPLFWTPSSIKNYAQEIHASMLSFNNDMARAKEQNKLPVGELEAWRTLRDRWSTWYGQTDAATWLFSSNVSIMESYANALTAFRAKYQKWVGRSAAGVDPTQLKAAISVDTSGKTTVDFDWTPVWWTLGILVIGGGGYWYWLHKKRDSFKEWRSKPLPKNWRSKYPKGTDVTRKVTVAAATVPAR